MKTVICDRMVFVGGSRVPAGTPFEVPDDAKLEPGMAEVEMPKATAKPESETEVKATEPETDADAKSEPQTLAEVAAAEAKGSEPKGAKGQARV